MVSPSRRSILLAVTLAVLIGVAGVAVGSIAASDPAEQDPHATIGENQVETDVEVSDALSDANGTETVVVRLDGADSMTVASSDEPVNALQRHAEETQADVRSFADERAGVEHQASYWIANAVVLEVDTDRVAIEELTRLDHVEALHENFEVNAPMPVESSEAETDGGAVTSLETAGDDETTYGVDMVNAEDVWEDYDTKGEGVRVAVLDTGIDVAHPDLDLYTDDPNDPTYPGGWARFTTEGEKVEGDTPADPQGHGTHVSGTVAGGNESGEHIGVAPDADLMHGAVLSADGSGSFAQIAAGIEWAVEEEADLISMSLGADGMHPELIEPVERAIDTDTMVITSSGNEGEGTSGSPANYYSTLSVGAVDENASVTDFSSGMEVSAAQFGSDAPDDWPNEYVVPDLSAPGDDVLSAYPGGDYQELPGTSMATPHVTGAAALMLSATSTDLSTDQVRDALVETSWKPDEAPPEQDVRYGHGIIDAHLAVATLRGDTGVTGTVERADDEARFPDATVTVELEDGTELSTETDDLGTYAIQTPPGSHEVTVDVDGYEDEPIDVDVADGEFATAHASMDRTLGVVVDEDAPDAIEPGEDYEITYDAWHADTLVVERDGDFDGNVTLSIETDEMFGEEELEFGEPFEFDDRTDDEFSDYPAEVELSVEPEEPGEEVNNETAGAVTLEAEFDGLYGENATETHGPTDVHVEEALEIAVLSDPIVEYGYDDESDRELGPALVDRLDDELDDHHEVELVRGANSVIGVVDEYDVYVVQDEPSTDAMRQFVEQTQRSDVGVVYLDQRQVANGITKLSEATGDPRGLHTPMPIDNSQIVSYDGSETDSDILDVEIRNETADYLEARGWADDHEHVPFREQEVLNFIEDYRSDNLAHIANEQCSFAGCQPRSIDGDGMHGEYGDVGGLGVDDLSRTVIASGLAETDTGIILDEGSELLGNAVHWAADDHGVSVEDHQPWKVDPGQTGEMEVSVPTTNETETDDPLESVTIGLNEHATVDPEEISIAIVDDEGTHDVELGETFEPTVENRSSIELSADIGADAFGELTFDHAYEVGNETITGATGPTSVYEGDEIRVTDDDDLQHVVDTVHVGDEVVVEDGTYDPIWVTADNVDVTIRAADGAEPVIEQQDERWEPHTRAGVIEVSADGVTIDGFTTDTSGQTYNNGVGVRHSMHEPVEDVTIENMRIVEPYQGVWAGSSTGQAHGVEIRNVEVEEPFWAGVRIHRSNDVLIEEVTVTEPGHNGIELGELSEDAIVRDNTIVDPEDAGVLLEVATATVENNEISGAQIGVEQESAGVGYVVDNEVTDSEVGVDLTLNPALHADPTWNATVVDNAFDTHIGVETSVLGELDYAADEPVHIRGNDFSETDVGVYDAHDGAMGPVDARLNYFGPHGPVDDPSVGERVSTAGDVTADPFLPDATVDYDQSGVATAVELEAGQTHAVGIPGPVSGTIDEMVTDAEGVIYGFDATENEWEQLGGNDSVDALEALLVVAETDGAITMNFESDADTPPSPESIDLETGWNFVSSPTYAPANDAFGHSSGDISLVSPDFAGPSDEPGDADVIDGTFSLSDEDVPTVSAFTGYFVFAEDDGELPARLGENPSLSAYANELGLDDGDDGEPSAGDGSAEAYYETVDHLIAEGVGVTPDEYHGALVEAIASETADASADVPANETDAFAEAAAGELTTTLAESTLEDEDDVVEAVETAIEQAAIVSAGSTTEPTPTVRVSAPTLAG
ncbi:S8 family serine peptidase [Halovivax gelatinilyticus]|uniref:S8 family serine peptidase n=1 Tax=Halovivax gelatinilyticus TaxID=2961597 RepID=UPI0020CA77C3|nr:S8 family serine peptidase [Halovivax gelatinilyticus]